MRIDKLLGNTGFGTRSEVKKMIKQKRVVVDGIVCVNSAKHVDPNTQVIEVDDEPVVYHEKLYIMLNKPKGVISATQDDMHPTVCDLLLPDILQEVFPIGRLDIDTTGLILLSNDGEVAHRIIHAKHKVGKTYLVELREEITSSMIIALEAGIMLDDEACSPAIVECIDSSHIHLTIYEGKYHQVKRMMHAVGNEVVELKRIKIGSLLLDDKLEEGMFKLLDEEEIQEAFK